MWYPYRGFLEGCSYACACSTRDSRRGAFFIASKPSPKRDALVSVRFFLGKIKKPDANPFRLIYPTNQRISFRSGAVQLVTKCGPFDIELAHACAQRMGIDAKERGGPGATFDLSAASSKGSLDMIAHGGI